MFLRHLAAVIMALAACGSFYQQPALQTAPPTLDLEDFGQLIVSLSEPEGYFDTDNFISNEAAYLRVLPALRRLGVRGGVYIGVGPDQNYSYIAEVQPDLAIIVDIRRQNALQHLYFKALFQLSKNRAEYMERLFGRHFTTGGQKLERAPISEMLQRLDLAPENRKFAAEKIEEARKLIRSWKLNLTDDDMRAVEYVANAFIEGRPDIKFTSYHRAPRPHHPTFRTLLQERDPEGKQTNYLASEERFQRVKTLHEKNRILPLVGDFGGGHAFRQIANELRRRGLEVKCFYASNVEFYLFRGDHWEPYVRNLRALPLAPDAYVIRSYANYWRPDPAQVNGYYMTTVLQSLRTFLESELSGKNGSYWDIVTRDCILQ